MRKLVQIAATASALRLPAVSILWLAPESVHASMYSKVRPLLAKYDYLLDVEAKVIKLAREQAELFAKGEAA